VASLQIFSGSRIRSQAQQRWQKRSTGSDALAVGQTMLGCNAARSAIADRQATRINPNNLPQRISVCGRGSSARQAAERLAYTAAIVPGGERYDEITIDPG